MQLSEIVSSERIIVPMEAASVEEAVGLLFQRLETTGALEKGVGVRLAGEFLSGSRGETVRINEWVVLGALQTDHVEGLTGCLGSAPVPFDLGEQEEGGTASVILLLLTPRRVSPLKIQAMPALSRFFRDKEYSARFRAGRTVGEILDFSEFMDLEVQDQLLVADGLTPLEYRVYPETPLTEVIGLMVRQGIRAVPVVGEKLDFLGLITSADAIRYLVPEQLTGAEGARVSRGVEAREVMSRSVMCISDDQSLVEGANLMVNRGVSQISVVRGGELVGFLTAETALRLLFGPKADE